jgi:flagellar protein FliO/FliZ
MYDLLASQPLAVRFFIAFVVVLILIGVTAWLVRRFGRNPMSASNARGRQPRLAVIDAAAVDSRRRLVLIRRDNVEHLLMIGGPTDVVIEPNIVRAMSAASREPARGALAPEAMGRQAAPAENAWPLQLTNEPGPPARHRAPPPEETWPAPEQVGRGRANDTLSGLAAELTSRLAPPESAPAPRGEPQRAAAPPPLAPEPPAPAQTDQNLAEMAHQLEAALRRGPPAEGRPPVTDPLAVNPPGKPAETPRSAPREFKPRVEPKFDARQEAKPEGKSWFEQRFEPKLEAKPEARAKAEPKLEPAPASAPSKTPYENLEDEMASLLGRPAAKG